MQTPIRNALTLMLVTLCMVGMSTQAHAAKAKPNKADQPTKERLVLMPLRVAEEDKSLQGAMETALVEGLQQKYVVFSGEQVAQKAREIFMKESRNTAKKDCDETRCMQNIAEAFQAELIATANVTKREDGYFLALSVQNIFDNKVVYSKSVPCKNCDAYQVVDKLKELSGGSDLSETDVATNAAERKLKSEKLKQDQLAFEQKLRNADASERKRLLEAKAKDDEHLVELKTAAEARRKSNTVRQSGDFATVESAIAEIKRLNVHINAIEDGYEKDLAQTRKNVSQRYTEQLNAVNKAQRDEFETSDEFKAKQEKQRADLIHQRDDELSRLNATELVEAETAPLRNSIKTLSEREYILTGPESLLVELGSYNADTQEFPIKVSSKTPAIKLTVNGTISLSPADAKAFKQQWQVGLVRAEVNVKPNGQWVGLALVNDADNSRRLLFGSKFMTNAQHEQAEIKPGKVFRDCPDCPEMVIIPTGSFFMGSSKDVAESPLHAVFIKQAFAMGKTEVTQAQWKTVMGNNPSNFKDCGDNCPVEKVSYDDAKEFIQKLNSKTGKQYRLPSEAEWEYACLAGRNDEYCGSNTVDDVAWYTKNSKIAWVGGKTTHPVAQKQANSFGLYDMSGNVWEWTEDSWHDNYNIAPDDGSAWPGDGAKRVIRGGSWVDNPYYERSAFRDNFAPAYQSKDLGFRVARILP